MSKQQKCIDVLTRARWHLLNGWCKRHLAVDILGEPCTLQKGRSFSLLGAVWFAVIELYPDDIVEVDRQLRAVFSIYKPSDYNDLGKFNDDCETLYPIFRLIDKSVEHFENEERKLCA